MLPSSDQLKSWALVGLNAFRVCLDYCNFDGIYRRRAITVKSTSEVRGTYFEGCTVYLTASQNASTS